MVSSTQLAASAGAEAAVEVLQRPTDARAHQELGARLAALHLSSAPYFGIALSCTGGGCAALQRQPDSARSARLARGGPHTGSKLYEGQEVEIAAPGRAHQVRDGTKYARRALPIPPPPPPLPN